MKFSISLHDLTEDEFMRIGSFVNSMRATLPAKLPEVVPPPVPVIEQTPVDLIPQAPVQVPQVPVQESLPELDARGFPWDESIHSSSKAINSDGTWKRRRGIEAADVLAVEQRYRGAQAGIAVPPKPEPIVEQAPVVPQPSTAEMTFDVFIGKIAAAMSNGKSADEVNRACSKFGYINPVAVRGFSDAYAPILKELGL